MKKVFLGLAITAMVGFSFQTEKAEAEYDDCWMWVHARYYMGSGGVGIDCTNGGDWSCQVPCH